MEIKTTVNKNHNHIVMIDEEGNGRTISTSPDDHPDHMHLVSDFIIEEFDDHTHLLNRETITKNKKETVITLNTGMGGKIEHITNLFQGTLNTLIISADKMVNIKIKLNQYDITLYEFQGLIGDRFLALRNDVTYSNNEKAQNFAAKWLLNDKLNIEIDGGLNTIVKLVFRLDNA